MVKTKAETADQVGIYLQSKQEFSLHEKLYWYRVILNGLLLTNEYEQSKEGKRFRYDFEKHKVIMLAMKTFLSSVEHADQANSNISPLLKAECKKIRETVASQLEQLFEEYATNQDLYAKENNLKDNPIACHSQMVYGIRSLHLDEIPSLLNAYQKAYMHGCQQLYKAFAAIDDEVATGNVSGIRAAWLADIILGHTEQIIHVYGAWRVSRVVNELFQKDFRAKGAADELPRDEREKQMLLELQPSSKQHDCHCCDEHEHQP